MAATENRRSSFNLSSSSDDLSNVSGNLTEEEVTRENRGGLLKVLANAIGLDVTKITLPVTLNEPSSFLMRMAEQLQYSDLLEQAVLLDNPVERMLYVSIFAISIYTILERTGKPFNPLLGETYELVEEEKNGFRFISEQVSHHPPIGSCFAETATWTFRQTQELKTKFTGNSLDCTSLGFTNVFLKPFQELYKWHPVKTVVHNVILGKAWLDHFGELKIVNKTTGEKAIIEFTKCGWFSKGWHEIKGIIYDARGTPCISVVGKWNESIYAQPIGDYSVDTQRDRQNSSSSDSGELALEMERKLTVSEQRKQKKKEEKELRRQTKEFKKAVRNKLNSEEPIWRHTILPLPQDKLECSYEADWTTRTFEIVALSDFQKNTLPPTDSRLRLDRLYLQQNETKKAAAAKHELEEKQRAERRRRGKREWTPRYFKKSLDSDGEEFYEYIGSYWEEREQRIAEYQTNKN